MTNQSTGLLLRVREGGDVDREDILDGRVVSVLKHAVFIALFKFVKIKCRYISSAGWLSFIISLVSEDVEFFFFASLLLEILRCVLLVFGKCFHSVAASHLHQI